MGFREGISSIIVNGNRASGITKGVMGMGIIPWN